MFEKVKEVLMEAINVDEDMIKLEANLKDDLGIDSLAAVELSLELETEFDVRIAVSYTHLRAHETRARRCV